MNGIEVIKQFIKCNKEISGKLVEEGIGYIKGKVKTKKRLNSVISPVSSQ